MGDKKEQRTTKPSEKVPSTFSIKPSEAPPKAVKPSETNKPENKNE